MVPGVVFGGVVGWGGVVAVGFGLVHIPGISVVGSNMKVSRQVLSVRLRVLSGYLLLAG